MAYTTDEVLSFVEENDVKFVRLVFCDLFGRGRNISLQSIELQRALTEGVSFDASAVPGLLHIAESDLMLRPDPNTLALLPWRPQQGRVARLICDIEYPGGKSFAGNSRGILCNAVIRAQSMGFACQIGVEVEFYLFNLDPNGNPSRTPHDNAGYLDLAPRDRGENVRREICLNLESMGIGVESSHHESGPGQNEIVLKYATALRMADNLLTLKQVIRTIAYKNGLFASFLPKPIPGVIGNGLHVNISLLSGGDNLFSVRGALASEADSFLSGIFRRAAEMTAILNPMPNSYERLGKMEAPGFVSWSHQNRSQWIRIPAAERESARMELRAPDPAANPYLAFALLINAGLEGIEQKLELPPRTDIDLTFSTAAAAAEAAGCRRLPGNLHEAVQVAQQSEFLKSVLPEQVMRQLFAIQCKADSYEPLALPPLEDALFDI